MKTNKRETGFTLLEMLVVMAIIGILAAVGFGQYVNSQRKAKDGQRKADLGNVARALEMYYNDIGSYPVANSGRLEVAYGAGTRILAWGESEFATDEVIYMKLLPNDSDPDWDYCYESDASGSYFSLYTGLENENDTDCDGTYSCGGDTYYCYAISSSNAHPTPY